MALLFTNLLIEKLVMRLMVIYAFTARRFTRVKDLIMGEKRRTMHKLSLQSSLLFTDFQA
jgi:hypothetical protein